MLRTLLPSSVPRRAAASPVSAWSWTVVLPLLCVAVLYVAASVGPAIFDQNEAQYAGAVREMMNRPADYVASARAQGERGQWFVPTNDGIPRLQKPPLVYWLLMASMRLFGVNEFAARLPNALFSLGWFGATFLLGARLVGRRYGVAAATILGTMAGTFIFTHLIAPEPFLAAFLTLTFWCFLSACQQPARAGRWMFAAWVFMGLGVGSKGLHGALYPLVVAGLLAWQYPQTRPVWRRLLHPAGPLVVLALLVPWYAAIEMKYPGFLHDQFINEQWGHVINQRFPPDNNRVPLPVFCVEHLVFFLPWTFFVPAAWHARFAWRAGRGGPVGRDLLRGWFWVTAGTLLFSSLQDYYLMTAWAPAALWLARPWATEVEENPHRFLPAWTLRGPGLALAGTGVLILLAGVYLAVHQSGIDAVRATPSAARDTILATLAGFSASAWHRLLPLAWAAGTAFLLGGLAAALLAANGRWWGTLNATALTMVAVLAIAARGMCVLEDYFSLKGIAQSLNHRTGPDATVVCAGEPYDNPSLLFYLDREIYWFHASAAREFASRELHLGSALFLSDGEFGRRWQSAQPTYLICEEEDASTWLGKLSSADSPAKLLAQSGTRVLLGNAAAR